MDRSPSVPTTPPLPDTQEDDLKKYVRTYEEDLQAAQKAGMPDLKAFVSRKPAPPPPPTRSAAPPPPPPPPVPHPVAPPPPPVRPIAPPPPPPPPVERVSPPSLPVFHAPAPPPPPIFKNEAVARPLQTYATNFQDRVRQVRASAATVIAAEQDAKRGAPAPDTRDKKPLPMALIYRVLGGLLLVAGLAGIVVAYVRYSASEAPIVATQTATAPILVDEQVAVSGTGTKLLEAIVDAANVSLPAGKVRLIAVAEVATSTANILALLPTSAPSVLVRNVNGEGSMVGTLSTRSGVASSTSQSAFLILSVTSYKETFAGMLAWEKTMLADLDRLFPSRVLALATSTAAQTTSTSVLFVDDTIANHDVRIARDARGQSIVVYGYWDPTTLVIARDAAAFADLLGRLANGRAGNK